MNETSLTQIPEEGTILEVTQEQYEAALTRGLTPEETLPPGRHRFVRGGFLKRMGITREELAAATVQVTVPLSLDDDVFKHFKQRADEAGATSLPSYLNDLLRDLMESERAVDTPAKLQQAA
jgi:hypothetical protein